MSALVSPMGQAHPPRHPVRARGVAPALALLGLAALSACAEQASPQAAAPARDTGSMSFPAPPPGSGFSRSAVSIPEMGSMQPPSFPAATGRVQPAPTGRDTGSMQQYPASK